MSRTVTWWIGWWVLWPFRFIAALFLIVPPTLCPDCWKALLTLEDCHKDEEGTMSKQPFTWWIGWIVLWPLRVAWIILTAPIVATCRQCWENYNFEHKREEEGKK